MFRDKFLSTYNWLVKTDLFYDVRFESYRPNLKIIKNRK